MKELDAVLQKLEILVLFLNTSLYSYSYIKGSKSIAVKYFVIYLTFTFFILTGSIFLIYLQKRYDLVQNNLFLSHFYFVFQFVFLSLFYRQLLNKKQKTFQVFISIFVFLLLIIQYAFNPKIYYKFNLLEIFITSFPLVLYAIFHLYNSLSKTGKFMYINAGVLIYLSLSTLIFILGNLINTIDKSLSFNIWFLNRVFYLGYLLLILIEWRKSLWKAKS